MNRITVISRLCLLVVFAALCTPAQAGLVRTTVFFDDFESDTLTGTPVISGSDIGISWDNSVPGGVDIVANPVMVGNMSTQVYQAFKYGSMDGNFTNGIPFDGATISMDFLLSTGAPGRRIDFGMQTADANSPAGEEDGLYFSPFAIKVRHDGDVHNSSGHANGFANDAFGGMSHFGTGIWQNASATFSHIGQNAANPSGDDWSVDLSFTNLITGDILSDTQTVILSADVKNQEFTQIYVRSSNNGDRYVDNVEVRGYSPSPVPIPAAVWLFGSAMAGLGFITRKRKGVVAA